MTEAQLNFEGELGRLQRAISESHEMIMQRSAVFEALQLRPGEKVLDVGCGGGSFACEAAKFVGSSGSVAGIDISEDQITAAQALCGSQPNVEFRVANALDLPYSDDLFDVVYAYSSLEYVPEIDTALSEIKRVLKPGGQLLIQAANWSSLVWYSNNPDRMRRMLAAVVDDHAPHRNLPSELPRRLRKAGLRLVSLQSSPFVCLNYTENSNNYYLSRLLHHAAVSQNLIAADEANAWLAEFDELEEERSYFFSIGAFLTLARLDYSL